MKSLLRKAVTTFDLSDILQLFLEAIKYYQIQNNMTVKLLF